MFPHGNRLSNVEVSGRAVSASSGAALAQASGVTAMDVGSRSAQPSVRRSPLSLFFMISRGGGCDRSNAPLTTCMPVCAMRHHLRPCSTDRSRLGAIPEPAMVFSQTALSMCRGSLRRGANPQGPKLGRLFVLLTATRVLPSGHRVYLESLRLPYDHWPLLPM